MVRRLLHAPAIMQSRLLALTLLGFGVLSLTPACDGADPETPDPQPSPQQCAPAAGPLVIHEEAPAGDETWTASAGVHIVRYPLHLAAGTTLTIEPCAEVLFEQDAGILLDKEGSRLVAEGTAEQPISFRGKDGARWTDIQVHHPAEAVLRHVRLENGGGDGFAYNATLVANGDQQTPAKRPLLVDHVTIRDSIGAGVLLQWAAAFAEGSTDLTITETGSDENPYPIRMGEQAIGSVPTGEYTGNRKDELLIVDEGANQVGGLQQDATLRDRGVPYHFGDWTNAHFFIGAGGKDAPLTTLTIEAGVTIRFEPNSFLEIEHWTGEFPASGAVRALGTKDKPVVFTSGAATPQPGDWGGLWFGGIARDSNVFENVRIEYAGHDCGCVLLSCNDLDGFEGAVIFSQQPPSNFFSGSSIAHVAGHGVVRGWRGTAGLDFLTGITYEDVSGCKQTRPQIEGQSCPSPMPSCPE